MPKDGIGYINTSKSGKQFITCYLTVPGGTRIKFGVFRNDYKRPDNKKDPDYSLVLFRDDKAQFTPAPPPPAPPPPELPTPEPEPADDIPF